MDRIQDIGADYFSPGFDLFPPPSEVECGSFPMNHFFQRGGVWVLLQNTLLAAVILMAVFFRGAGFILLP
jgi:hypothetical protein